MVQQAPSIGAGEVTGLFNGSAMNVVRDAVMGRSGTMILQAPNGAGWVFIRGTEDAMLTVATKGSPLNALTYAKDNGGTVYGADAAKEMMKFFKDQNYVRVVVPTAATYAKALIQLVEGALTTPFIIPVFPFDQMVPSNEVY